MIANEKSKIKTWLFNPFQYIAGVKSLIIGLLLMAIAAWIGFLNNAHFDGVIDLHLGRQSPFSVFMLEAIINWLSISIILFILGMILSKSNIRWVDVFGTQALARSPMLLLALLLFFPGFGKMNFGSLSISLVIFGLISLLVIIWMITLMFNAYKISCNLSGTKLIVSFIGGLISAEVISKMVIVNLVLMMIAQPVSASSTVVPVQGQTDKTDVAKKVLSHFEKSEFELIPNYFDETMKNALPTEKLEGVWTGLNKQVGKYATSSTISTAEIQQYDVVYILCHFTKTNLKMKVVFNNESKVAGLFFIPENQN